MAYDMSDSNTKPPHADASVSAGSVPNVQEIMLPNENVTRTLPKVVHPKSVTLRVAEPKDDLTVAQFYHDMWADFGIEDILAEDWQAQTLEFIAHARKHLDYNAFLAEQASNFVPSVTPSLEEVEVQQTASDTVDSTDTDSAPNSTSNSTSVQVLAVAACQQFAGPYPFAFMPSKRLYGYIWGVRVVPDARRQGLATLLTKACRDYLGQLGCNRILLHASPQGRKVYEQLGFEPSNEMRLELTQPADD
ncbi:MAG: GNAT family N-acetyltransferase [Deinococcota bacterium]